jgi:hypothetical protein
MPIGSEGAGAPQEFFALLWLVVAALKNSTAA